MKPVPARTLERVRNLCLAYPETSERLSHGAPTFFVRKSTFVTLMSDHHGDGRLALWCAAPPGAAEAMIAADPATFFRPPYVGARGWVGVRIEKPNWKAVTAIVADAYRHVAPAKLVALLE